MKILIAALIGVVVITICSSILVNEILRSNITIRQSEIARLEARIDSVEIIALNVLNQVNEKVPLTGVGILPYGEDGK